MAEEPVGGCEAEPPRVEHRAHAAGLAGMRSTRYVEFHTGRPRYPVQKCHLNAAVYDT